MSLWADVVVHCSLCTKHWSWLLLFIVHCHCLLKSLFFVVLCFFHSCCNVFCIVIVRDYHCQLFFAVYNIVIPTIVIVYLYQDNLELCIFIYTLHESVFNIVLS